MSARGVPRPAGKPLRPTKGGYVYAPNSNMADAIVACLIMADEVALLALRRGIPRDVASELIALRDKMDAKVYETTGVHYHNPMPFVLRGRA